MEHHDVTTLFRPTLYSALDRSCLTRRRNIARTAVSDYNLITTDFG